MLFFKQSKGPFPRFRDNPFLLSGGCFMDLLAALAENALVPAMDRAKESNRKPVISAWQG